MRRSSWAAASGLGLFSAADVYGRTEKPKIAAVVTTYTPTSHADVLLGRLIRGYTLEDEPFWPRVKVVSLYVDQFSNADLARPLAERFRIPIAPTIKEALTLGSEQLAVDGVLIVGEHGDYPFNEFGQQMYPRRRFFEETVDVFRAAGKTAPVFNDKHLSYTWQDAKWMYDAARTMGFPLMAGSSLPTTWRRPELEIPQGAQLEEAVAVGYGSIEAYGFHALEMLQCMVERRAGGETGVRSVACLEGADVWRAAESGVWSWDVLAAAMEPAGIEVSAATRERCPNPVAFVVEYNDGLKGTVLMLNGVAREFSFAVRYKSSPKPVGTLFWLQEPVYGHFAYLAHNVEELFLTGEEPYPPERTLLTTGVLDAAMQSRHQNHRRIETPWLAEAAYKPTGRAFRRAYG